jgi:hypothetical protein
MTHAAFAKLRTQHDREIGEITHRFLA